MEVVGVPSIQPRHQPILVVRVSTAPSSVTLDTVTSLCLMLRRSIRHIRCIERPLAYMFHRLCISTEVGFMSRVPPWTSRTFTSTHCTAPRHPTRLRSVLSRMLTINPTVLSLSIRSAKAPLQPRLSILLAIAQVAFAKSTTAYVSQEHHTIPHRQWLSLYMIYLL